MNIFEMKPWNLKNVKIHWYVFIIIMNKQRYIFLITNRGSLAMFRQTYKTKNIRTEQKIFLCCCDNNKINKINIKFEIH